MDLRVIAVAPFFEQRMRALGVWRTTHLALIGQERSDYNDLLVAQDEAGPALHALALHLAARRNRFDAVVMRNLPDHSPSVEPWLDALRAAGLAPLKRPSESCPRVYMGDTWNETLATLPPTARGKTTKRQRVLVKRHGARVELLEGSSIRPQDVEDFIAMHQFRWIRAGGKGAFADVEFAAFFRDAVLRMAAVGRLTVCFLYIDGRRAAAALGFLHRDEFHYYLNALGDAGEAQRQAPGMALTLWLMEALHSRGIRVYDFLRGEEQYKYDIGATSSPTWSVVVYGRRWGLGEWAYRPQMAQSRVLTRLATERTLFREAVSSTAEAGRGRGGIIRQHLAARALVALGKARH
jgi:CelD/BcsL family acetyltransferase involved in cellulose biosynthesis